MHPDAQVTGTDLSLIQPENAPPNVSFIKEDSEKDDWVFPSPFDFIFLRLVVTGFDDHTTVIKKAYDNLRPGGWIEFNDVLFQLFCTDGTADGTHIQKWSELVLQAGDAIGRDFRAVAKYKQWLLEAGFVDVKEEIIPCPSESCLLLPRGKEGIPLRIHADSNSYDSESMAIRSQVLGHRQMGTAQRPKSHSGHDMEAIPDRIRDEPRGD